VERKDGRKEKKKKEGKKEKKERKETQERFGKGEGVAVTT
jgi:hypothetical protein